MGQLHLQTYTLLPSYVSSLIVYLMTQELSFLMSIIGGKILWCGTIILLKIILSS